MRKQVVLLGGLVLLAVPLSGLAAIEEGLAEGPKPDAGQVAVQDPRAPPPCGTVLFLVEECGDTMTGNLVMSGAAGVSLAATLLSNAGSGLAYGANAVCLAGVGIAGCGDIDGVLGAAGSGITGGAASGTVTLNTDANVLQRRVAGACGPGQSIQSINAAGGVACQTAGVGTVTSVATGAGLTGGPITGSGTISIAPAGITGSMINSATTINAAGYTLSAPVARSVAINPVAFNPGNSATAYIVVWTYLYATTAGQAVTFSTPLNLPDGAVITSIKAYVEDSAATNDITFRLLAKTLGGNSAVIAGSVTSSGALGITTLEDTTIAANPVDNDFESHILEVSWTVPATPTQIRLRDVVVTYTVTAPLP